MPQIHDLTAVEQVDQIRRRELSPVEVTDHYLARIERHGERIGAFVSVAQETAREQARNAERRIRADADAGAPSATPPLSGLCVPVKDLDMVAGERWTWGAEPYRDQVARIDEEYVAELRAAGAVIPGKTNTPEFGLTCYTENAVAPPARTPWDLALSAGGSSGGAAAAVAAGLAPVAQGSDGGGSIRIPASVCGLYGIKPTRGRVTAAPVRPDLIGLAATGPLARTVADAAMLLDVLAVNRPGDYYTAPPLDPDSTFLEHATRDPGRLRIAAFSAPPVRGAEAHPDVLAAYRSTLALLGDLGHEVEEIEAPFDPAMLDRFELVWAAMATRYPVAPADEPRLRPITRWLRERAGRHSIAEYLDATSALQQAVRAALAALQRFDAVLTPTVALPPVPVGHFDADGDPEAEFRRMAEFTPYTTVFNITGQPAVSLPLHVNEAGLPIGVQLAGRMGGEPTLIALSAQLEAARPWADRKPPIWDE
ncbi:amidase [Murinocardiopsis flavida]|uniref:Amidase n=1 Tax=Murinocardiopsis flavida TaxID=645275 RepID=A0A2P8DUE2_9ACTN|nr:amidase [Murinocardiopsis flavida]PSL00822.1 amidase [Murinocardiopsis flavida]